jgi:hypothetical protein
METCISTALDQRETISLAFLGLSIAEVFTASVS